MCRQRIGRDRITSGVTIREAGRAGTTPGAAAAIVLAVAVLVAAAALIILPVPVLDVTHVGIRRLLWRVAVRDGSRVDLSYVNSIFNAPTTERFVVEAGRLRLVEVTTTNEAVFEYLRLDPPYEVGEGRLVARTRGPSLEGFTTRIGQTGQQRLVVDGAEFPLFRIGVGEAARLEVRRVPRIALWLHAGRPP